MASLVNRFCCLAVPSCCSCCCYFYYQCQVMLLVAVLSARYYYQQYQQWLVVVEALEVLDYVISTIINNQTIAVDFSTTEIAINKFNFAERGIFCFAYIFYYIVNTGSANRLPRFDVSNSNVLYSSYFFIKIKLGNSMAAAGCF